MGIALWIVFGLAAAVLAKTVMPGPDPAGTGGTTLLGMAGALLGGLSAVVLFGAPWLDFDGRGLLLAMIGALAVLFSYRCFAARATD
jgi:uncharacterized membrane protein YeaQ/YmgE (transglycosylase-associated protein family)